LGKTQEKKAHQKPSLLSSVRGGVATSCLIVNLNIGGLRDWGKKGQECRGGALDNLGGERQEINTKKMRTQHSDRVRIGTVAGGQKASGTGSREREPAASTVVVGGFRGGGARLGGNGLVRGKSSQHHGKERDVPSHSACQGPSSSGKAPAAKPKKTKGRCRANPRENDPAARTMNEAHLPGAFAASGEEEGKLRGKKKRGGKNAKSSFPLSLTITGSSTRTKKRKRLRRRKEGEAGERERRVFL